MIRRVIRWLIDHEPLVTWTVLVAAVLAVLW